MQSNLTLTLGFKGHGAANGVPVGVPTGYWTLGGYQDPIDTQLMKFGVLVSGNPSANDGDFFCGALSRLGTASVYTIAVTGTVVNTGYITIDAVPIAVTSGLVASGVAGLINAAVYGRWTTTVSTSTVTFTSKVVSQVPAPFLVDSVPASGPVYTPATVTAGTIGYVPRGITLYDASVAQNDPAKPNYMLQGVPVSVMYEGQLWLASWIGNPKWIGGTAQSTAYYNQDAAGNVLTGSINPPVIGCNVVASNVTGEIGFVASGVAAPTNYSIINASVKSVSTDTSGVMLFVYI